MPERRYSVYLFRCSDGTLYCGITTNIARRVREHNQGTASKYTRGRRPVQILAVRHGFTYSEALKEERRVKDAPRAWKEKTLTKWEKKQKTRR